MEGDPPFPLPFPPPPPALRYNRFSRATAPITFRTFWGGPETVQIAVRQSDGGLSLAQNGQNPGAQRFSGQVIIDELLRNMEIGSFEMAYSTLLPCVFSVYLHPEDHARL